MAVVCSLWPLAHGAPFLYASKKYTASLRVLHMKPINSVAPYKYQQITCNTLRGCPFLVATHHESCLAAWHHSHGKVRNITLSIAHRLHALSSVLEQRMRPIDCWWPQRKDVPLHGRPVSRLPGCLCDGSGGCDTSFSHNGDKTSTHWFGGRFGL